MGMHVFGWWFVQASDVTRGCKVLAKCAILVTSVIHNNVGRGSGD